MAIKMSPTQIAAIESIGAEGLGRMLTRGISSLTEKEFLNYMRALSPFLQSVVVKAIEFEGPTMDWSAAGLEALIESAPIPAVLKIAGETLVEGLVEGLSGFVTANLDGRTREVFKAEIIKQIRGGDAEMFGPRGNRREAGEACIRKDGRFHITNNSLCDKRGDDIDAHGSFQAMCASYKDTPLCLKCFPSANDPEVLVAGQLVLPEPPPPPEVPNWIRHVDADRRSALLGAYMAGLDHAAYDAVEESDEPDGAERRTRTSPRRMTFVEILGVTLSATVLIGGVLVGSFYSGPVGIIVSFLGVLGLALTVTGGRLVSTIWNLVNFRNVAVEPRTKFESLDGNAFKLIHGLEWMAKRQPKDLNELLKSSLDYAKVRENLLKEMPELVPAVLMTTHRASGIPWWVAYADMADMAVQMPTVRRWLRLAFVNGGRFAVRAALLLLAFVLMPVLIVYAVVLCIAIFLLANGVAGLFYAFGITDSHGVFASVKKVVEFGGIDRWDVDELGYQRVYGLELFFAIGQVWLFRLIFVPLGDIPAQFVRMVRGKTPEISAYTGRETFGTSLARWVNSSLPESLQFGFPEPLQLKSEELETLLMNQRVAWYRRIPVVITLLVAVTGVLGFMYRVWTGQWPSISMLTLSVLWLGIAVEFPTLLGHLRTLERRKKEANTTQRVLFGGIVVVFSLAMMCGFGESALDTISHSYKEWTQQHPSSSSPVATPPNSKPKPPAKPTGKQEDCSKLSGQALRDCVRRKLNK